MPRIVLLVVLLVLGIGLPAQTAFAILDTGGGANTLSGDNAPPEAAADEISTAKGTPGDADVLANDVDPDDDPLTIESWTQGTDGSVTCAGSVCVYTPDDPSFIGSDSFTYTVSDGNGGADVGDVFVTVTTSNGQPVADDDALTTAEDTQGGVDVLDGDTDEDDDPLTVTTPSPTADHGAVSCTSGGICTYTPDPDFNGSDTFSYEIDDGHGGADTGDVAITVTPVNDDPNAVDDSLITAEDTFGSLNVRTNDTDVDGDTLLVTTPSPAAAHGTVSCLAGGLCTYTPDAGYLGADSFTYTVSDGLATDEGLVSVTVEAANVAPGCANVKPSRTTLWPPHRQLISVKLSGATDPNGDPLIFAITAVRQDEKVKGIGGRVDKGPDAQRVSGKPDQIRLRAERDSKGNGRVYRVVYEVSDGRGGTCTGVEKVGVPVKKGKKAIETAKSFNSFG